MKPRNKELALEEIQQRSFLVLKKIKEIFEKNNWNYFLAYGTLLGAIRHEGFIPWDDDIDIFVPRPDYEKFIKYCNTHKKELAPFELIHYSNNKNYIYPIARFSDSRYKIDYDNVNDYGLGLFVDIYPLDGVNSKDIIQKLIIKRLNKTAGGIGLISPKSDNKIKNYLKKPYIKFIKNFSITKILKKCDKLARKYNYETSEMVDCACWGLQKESFKKEYFTAGKCEKKFNGELFSVPIGYDEILTRCYGDYMKLPPKSERIAHHFYSAYKK